MGRRAVWLLLLLAACGGGTAARGRARPMLPGEGDVAARLAARLPQGARECVAVREAGLAAVERRGLRWVSRALPLAWVPGFDVEAYASASQLSTIGERSDVILLRTAAPHAVVRAALSANPWLRVVWEGESEQCEDLDCTRTVARARFEEDGVVRIERGTWRPARRSRMDGRCAAAMREGDATETAAFDQPYHVPSDHWEQREVRLAERGVAVITRIQLRDVGPVLAIDELMRSVPDGTTRVVSRRLEGTAIVTRAEATWDDLSIAAADEDRLARALAYESSLAAPQPVESIDVNDAGLVATQVDARRTAVSALHGDARTTAVRELEALLARAHAARPDDTDVAHALFRARLDELHDAQGASRIAAEMRDRAPDDPGWPALERDAVAAAGDASRLATLLVRDGMVPDRTLAARAAQDVVAARADGVPVAWAEGALRADALLDAAHATPQAAIARPVELPLRSLPSTLLALLRLGTTDRFAPRAFYLRADGAMSGPPARVGAGNTTDDLPAPPVPLHDARGRTRLFLGAPADDGAVHLRRLGDALAARAQDGPLAVRVALVPFTGEVATQRPEVVLDVDGTVTAGVLRVAHVSRAAARVDWDLVARMLAAPLAALPPRTGGARPVGPPPDVPVEARSVEEATRLAAHAEPDVHCARDGAHLECRPIVGGPDDLFRVLFSLADELLGSAPRAVWPLPRAPRPQ